jgi:glycerol-3-phosphate acyltransferase PlsY
MTYALLIIFAYLLGSVPFGLLLGRIFADVDIREFGSKNIGATNVNRILGRKLGAATLLADVLKGLLPVLLARLLGETPIEQLWVGFAAFAGHIFPIYLKFRGGKGVATALGVVLPIAPLSALIAVGLWLLVVRLSKVSALGALVASLSIPVSSFFMDSDWRITGILLLMVILIIYRHRENIERLRSGKEIPLNSSSE